MTLSTWSIVLFAHVLAASLLVGSAFSVSLIRRGIESAASVAELRSWLELGRRATRANPAVAVVLLATGVWLGREVWWAYAWFWVAVGAWVVNSALAAGVVRRAAGAASRAAALVGDGPVTTELDGLRRSRAWHLAEAAMAANDVALLWVMIDKPTLAGSLAVVALANLLFVGAMALSRRRAEGAGARPLGAATAP